MHKWIWLSCFTPRLGRGDTQFGLLVLLTLVRKWMLSFILGKRIWSFKSELAFGRSFLAGLLNYLWHWKEKNWICTECGSLSRGWLLRHYLSRSYRTNLPFYFSCWWFLGLEMSSRKKEGYLRIWISRLKNYKFSRCWTKGSIYC